MAENCASLRSFGGVSTDTYVIYPIAYICLNNRQFNPGRKSGKWSVKKMKINDVLSWLWYYDRENYYVLLDRYNKWKWSKGEEE